MVKMEKGKLVEENQWNNLDQLGVEYEGEKVKEEKETREKVKIFFLVIA